MQAEIGAIGAILEAQFLEGLGVLRPVPRVPTKDGPRLQVACCSSPNRLTEHDDELPDVIE